MPKAMQHVVASLEKHYARYLGNAWTPYSESPSFVFLVFSDGSWIPGVRIESASYPLAIPCLINAVSTMHALRRRRPALIHFSRPATRSEFAYLEDREWLPLPGSTDRTLIFDHILPEKISDSPLPPFLITTGSLDHAGLIDLARQQAENAYIPESDFPVGCVLETSDGQLIPGVNVEHPDWTRTLCAERNALGTAFSYGIRFLNRYFLTCLKAPGCTPCGACRQLMAELTPNAELWMDQGNQPPLCTRPNELLPASFDGSALLRD